MSGKPQALILAGGIGTRLWPRSRKSRPKQFLRIHTAQALLRQTATRLLPIFEWERIWVIAQPEHVEHVRTLLPDIDPSHILVEPCPKGTAAAITWAAYQIENACPGCVVAVFPSDHLIEDEAAFRSTVAAATERAAGNDEIVILGLRPDRPETAYGYVELGGRLGVIAGHVCRKVIKFHEKPDEWRARTYVAFGHFLWNSGIFILRPQVLFRALERVMPDVLRIVEALGPALRGLDEAELKRLYAGMPAVSIDKGLVEHLDNVVVFPAEFGWYDIGLWVTYYERAIKDAQANAVDGQVVQMGCQGSLLRSDRKILVAAIGLKDMVVIAEGDVVLVCPKSRLDEIGLLVEKLQALGLERYL